MDACNGWQWAVTLDEAHRLVGPWYGMLIIDTTLQPPAIFHMNPSGGRLSTDVLYHLYTHFASFIVYDSHSVLALCDAHSWALCVCMAHEYVKLRGNRREWPTFIDTFLKTTCLNDLRSFPRGSAAALGNQEIAYKYATEYNAKWRELITAQSASASHEQ